MEGIAITHEGFEELASLEIKNIINKSSKLFSSAVVFSISEYKELCSLVYNSRILRSVLFKLAAFQISSVEDIKKNFRVKLLTKWISDKTTFAVRCSRIGSHEFSSKDIEEELGELISKSLDLKANLSSPDLIVKVEIINDYCYIGIDFAGIDLSKREYRIFSYGDIIKSTVAQGMNYMAEISSKDTILDPFSSSGVISIEAALFLLKKSPYYYGKDDFAFLNLVPLRDFDFEKFFEEQNSLTKDPLKIYCGNTSQKNVRSAEKNAKIAGVNKEIKFSRTDIEWWDTKFDEGSVDKIVTVPPQPSKHSKPGVITKLLDEFFYVSKFILSKNGRVVLAFKDKSLLLPLLERHGFCITKELNVMQGMESVSLFLIKKS